MLYPFVLMVLLIQVPYVDIGNAGFMVALVATAGVTIPAVMRRITLSRKMLVLVIGGLVIFDAPYNMQRIIYQLPVVICIALFLASCGWSNGRGRMNFAIATSVALLVAMTYFGLSHETGLANAYADWAIIGAIPFYFFVRLVDRRAFTVLMCFGFGFVMMILENTAAIIFPTAVLMSWVFPKGTRVRSALLVALGVSFTITVLAIKFSLLIPHQGLFMRSFIWNEMWSRLSLSPTSLFLGIPRFRESGYVWLSDSSLLLDARQSYATNLLFDEMTHNYIFGILVFGGLKGAIVVGAFLLRYLKGLTFARRSDLGIFFGVFVYLTFDGFKLLSPDGVSICSTILICLAIRSNKYFNAASEDATVAPSRTAGRRVSCKAALEVIS